MSLLRDSPADLRDAIVETATRIGIAERQVEKDYWVTEVLRELVRLFDGQFLFKGGTSLSKAYALVERFSEDVDLLLMSEEGEATEALLDDIENAARHVLGHEPQVVSRTGGLARKWEVSYPELPNTRRAPGMRRQVLIEPGVRGGPHPHERREIRSLIAAELGEGSFEDLTAFWIDVLHAARTMVEKLFAVEAMGSRLLADPNARLRDTEARHFYDLYFLFDEEKSEALAWVGEGDNLSTVVADCVAVSRRWYGTEVVVPDGGFSNSACFIEDDLARRIEPAYNRMLEAVCYPKSERPSFGDIRARAGALAGRI